MIRGFYSAASGLDAASSNQDVIAENLANVNTPGYRRRGLAFQVFEDVLANVPPPTTPEQAQRLAALDEGGLLGTLPTQVFNDFRSGPVQYTGNPFDLAAAGDAYFIVEGPGGTLFTKNGSFRLNAQGELLTQSGLRVRGEGGTLTIPQGTAKVVVNLDGSILADGQAVGRLQIERIANPVALQRVGPSLFQGQPSGVRPEPGTIRIEQGYLEGSNVQGVSEMVSMVTGARYYEMAQRALRTLSEAIALNTRPQS